MANMQRGTSTQYVFQNGNVEYKVYSGGQANSNTTVYTFDEESEEEEDHFNDIFNQFFTQRPRIQQGNQQTRSNQNNNPRHNHNTNGQIIFTNNAQKQNPNGLTLYKLLQFLPVLFLLFFVFVPYLIR